MEAVPQHPDPFGLMRDLAPPVKRGAQDKPRVLKQVQRRHSLQPMRRKDVVQWSYQLRSWTAALGLPANGRAVKRLYGALIELMNWRSGRLDPAGRTIGYRADYRSQTTVWKWIGWLKERQVVAVIPCCNRVIAEDGRFLLVQDTNVYVFLPPSNWRGYKPKAKMEAAANDEQAPAPAATESTATSPVLDSHDQWTLLRQKLASAEARLASEPNNAGTAALVQLYREQLAVRAPPPS